MISNNNVIADRVKRLKPSATVALPDKARALREAGLDVIDLSEGEPYFDTPEKIKVAAKRALDEGFVHYISSAGLKELRQAIAEKLRTENKVDVKASETIVTVGAKQALFTAFLTVINPGDEVLIPEPSYVSYQAQVIVPGGKPVSVSLLETRDFRLDEEEIKEKITEKTKAVILNSPNNPVGTVFTKGDLKMIADIVKDYNLLVITDEIYEKIIYDGLKHYSIGSFSGVEDRTVTINSLSKTYAMTGFRIGYLAAKENLAKHINKVHYYISISPNSLSQKAALAALLGPQNCVSKMVKEYDRRRRLGNELSKIDRVCCLLPKGAFYFFPKISEKGMTSEEFARYLLEEARVAVTPGSGLGNYGEGYIRMSFAAPFEKVKEAIKRIRVTLEELNQEL